jgi:hypothetical protein
MMDKPAEIQIFDFLTDKVAASVAGDIIYGIELHDTVYQAITKDRGVRVSDAVGDFSPGPEMVEKEYDVFVELACFSRVGGQDVTARQPALIDVFNLQKEIYRIIREDSTLGGRVCDSLLIRGARGYDTFDSEPYAVGNVRLIINPSGARYNE